MLVCGSFACLLLQVLAGNVFWRSVPQSSRGLGCCKYLQALQFQQQGRAVKQLRPNKALHPTAYSSVHFARASLHSLRFRRRVSLSLGRGANTLLSGLAFAVPTLSVPCKYLRRVFCRSSLVCLVQVLASGFLRGQRGLPRASFPCGATSPTPRPNKSLHLTAKSGIQFVCSPPVWLRRFLRQVSLALWRSAKKLAVGFGICRSNLSRPLQVLASVLLPFLRCFSRANWRVVFALLPFQRVRFLQVLASGFRRGEFGFSRASFPCGATR